MEINIHEIYNYLFAGKLLSIPFSTKEDAEVLRVRLYKYKAQQDCILSATGNLVSKQVLAFSLQASLPGMGMPAYTAKIQLRDPEVQRKYTVTFVEEDEENKENGTDTTEV